MKKFTSSLLIATIFAITPFHDISAARMSKSQRRQWNTYLRQQKSSSAKASDFAKASTDATADKQSQPSFAKASAGTQNQQKNPEIKKQEQQLNQQIKRESKSLEQALDKQKKATTPEEKQQADQEVIEISQELFNNLEERSTLEDIWYGYSDIRKKNAKTKIKILEPVRTRIIKNIEILEQRLQPITITNKGLIWTTTSAKPGKEKEYTALTNKLKKQKDDLAKVEREIRNQSVVAGKEWANTYRLLFAGGLVGAWYYGPMALLTAQKKLGYAMTAYNFIVGNPNATQEEIDKAKARLDQTKKELAKAKEAQKNPTPAPAKK